jgi:hypothetical protein
MSNQSYFAHCQTGLGYERPDPPRKTTGRDLPHAPDEAGAEDRFVVTWVQSNNWGSCWLAKLGVNGCSFFLFARGWNGL